MAGGKRKLKTTGGHGKELGSELRDSEAKGVERWSEEEDGTQESAALPNLENPNPNYKRVYPKTKLLSVGP